MPITISKEVLAAIDGLFFLEDDAMNCCHYFIVSLSQSLRSRSYSKESVKNLVPYVSSLKSKLNYLSCENNEKGQEINELCDNLKTVKSLQWKERNGKNCCSDKKNKLLRQINHVL